MKKIDLSYEIMVKIVLVTVFFFVHCFLNGHKIHYKANPSSSLQSYGCLEKANVTVLVQDMSNEGYLNGLASLLDGIDKDPC